MARKPASKTTKGAKRKPTLRALFHCMERVETKLDTALADQKAEAATDPVAQVLFCVRIHAPNFAALQLPPEKLRDVAWQIMDGAALKTLFVSIKDSVKCSQSSFYRFAVQVRNAAAMIDEHGFAKTVRHLQRRHSELKK